MVYSDRNSDPAPVITGRDTSAYIILGITPASSVAQIRLAYLRLMKTNHPDVAGADEQAPSAVDLNQAYWWLSDPERRARYDQALQAPYSVHLRPSGIIAPPLRLRFRWGRILAAASVLFATSSALIYHDARSRQAPAGVEPAASPPAVGQAALGLRRSAIVREAGLNFEWIALQADEPAVATYSAECWTSLSGDGSDGLLDYCLAFDKAAQRTFGTTAAYFDTAAIILRAHLTARHLGPDEPTVARFSRIDRLLARIPPHESRRSRYDINWFPMTPSAVEARLTQHR